MYRAIGERIRHIRIQRQMTQQQLAALSGISVSFLGHIERGSRKLSVDTLVKIARALDCSADELLGTGLQQQANLSLLLSMAARQLEQERYSDGCGRSCFFPD